MRLIIDGVLHFIFFSLPKGMDPDVDDAQSILGYALSTKLSFHILFSSASCAHPSHDGLWTESGCVGEASLPGLPSKRETC